MMYVYVHKEWMRGCECVSRSVSIHNSEIGDVTNKF